MATPGICVSVPPCVAYRSPTFFTPGVSKALLFPSLLTNEMRSEVLFIEKDSPDGIDSLSCPWEEKDSCADAAGNGEVSRGQEFGHGCCWLLSLRVRNVWRGVVVDIDVAVVRSVSVDQVVICLSSLM